MLSVFEMHSVATLLALSTKEKRKLIALRKISGRGFPFVFREKPFGWGRICANFAIVKRERRPKGISQRRRPRPPQNYERENKIKETALVSKKLESSYKHL